MRIQRHWLLLGLFITALGVGALGGVPQRPNHPPALVRTGLALQASVPVADLATLVQHADLIVRGWVVESQSGWNRKHTLIETRHQIQVRYTLFGQASTPLWVRTLGGELLSEDVAVAVSRSAHFERNEEVVLFLRASPEGYQVVGHEDGKFALTNGVARQAHVDSRLAYPDLVAAVTQELQRQGKTVFLPANWREQEQTIAATGQTAAPNGFAYAGHKWAGTNPVVKYKINLNTSQAGGSNGSVEDFRKAIQAAAETWSNIPQAEFTLVYDGESTVTDVAASNRQNDIIFMRQGADGLIGLGFVWYRPSDKQTIIEADIWLNDDFPFDATGSIAADEYDLQSAILHELGHWLVLEHDEESSSVMFALLDQGTLRRELQANDIAGIQCLYNGTGTVCTPPAATATPTPAATQSVPITTPTSVSPTFTPTAISPTLTPIPTATICPRQPTEQVVYLPVVQH